MSHPSPRWGTQVTLYKELAGPEGSIAVACETCTHTHGWSWARVDHCGQDRTLVHPTLLHLTSSPSGEVMLWSHTDWSDIMTNGCTSAGGMIMKIFQDEATLCQLGAPFYPGSHVLHLGINSGQWYMAAQTRQSNPPILGCLATV